MNGDINHMVESGPRMTGISQCVEDPRTLRIHFKEPVTGEIREWLKARLGVQPAPEGSNADEWLLLITESSPEYAAVQVAERIEAARRTAFEEAAALWETVNPASDEERMRGDPGAGAMGAIIDFRDAICAMKRTEQ